MARVFPSLALPDPQMPQNTWLIFSDPYIGCGGRVVKRAAGESIGVTPRWSGQRSSAAALAQFRQDWAGLYRVIEVTPALVTRATAFAKTCAWCGDDAVECPRQPAS